MTITPYVPSTLLSGVPTGVWSGVNSLAVMPFLPGQDIAIDKSPMWNTKVVVSASGRERRTAIRPYPLWQFGLKYEVVRHKSTVEELGVLWEFFNVAQGKFNNFLFLDPTDNYVTAGQFGTGTGSQTAFQLQRTINSWYEPIYAAYLPSIYVNGTLQTLGTNYTLGTNGIVTFTSAPASGAVLTWTGYFYYFCRFDQDDFKLTQIVQKLWSNDGLKFTSCIP